MSKTAVFYFITDYGCSNQWNDKNKKRILYEITKCCTEKPASKTHSTDDALKEAAAMGAHVSRNHPRFRFSFYFFSKCSAWLETYSVASPWRRARAIAGQENPGRGGPIAHRLRKGKRGAAPGRRNDSGLDGGYRGPDPWGNVPALSASLVSRVH